jgi:hypothetical protein
MKKFLSFFLAVSSIACAAQDDNKLVTHTELGYIETQGNTKTTLTSKLSDIFSAGLSYKVDYVNLPSVQEYADTTFTANAIIDY